MAFISIKYIRTLCALMENSTLTQYVYTCDTIVLEKRNISAISNSDNSQAFAVSAYS